MPCVSEGHHLSAAARPAPILIGTQTIMSLTNPPSAASGPGSTRNQTLKRSVQAAFEGMINPPAARSDQPPSQHMSSTLVFLLWLYGCLELYSRWTWSHVTTLATFFLLSLTISSWCGQIWVEAGSHPGCAFWNFPV